MHHHVFDPTYPCLDPLRPHSTSLHTNIHKGFSQFNRSLMVHELRERLRALNPDLIFLQEVTGAA